MSCHLQIVTVLCLSFQFGFLFFFFAIAVTRTSNAVLNKSGESGDPRGNAFSFALQGMMWAGLPWRLRDKEFACQLRRHGFDPLVGNSLEKKIATHSSILAWIIPWADEPGGLQSMGSQRVEHD